MKYLIYFFSILTILKCQDLILFDDNLPNKVLI